MSSSRRTFLHGSLGTLGAAAAEAACSRKKPASQSRAVKKPDPFEAAYLKADRAGLLKRREEQMWEVFRSCRLCPRACGVNRLNGEKGVCQSTSELVVHSAGPHVGEEKPLVGKGGSGTVFFSACNLRCVFCQNWEINHRGDGRVIRHEDLAMTMVALQTRGCHNINFVTPTHVVPHILRAVRLAIPRGLKVPLVYNTGGYDHPDTIKALDGIVDIYLPDFKYQDEKLAVKYSSDAKGYPKIASETIKEMDRQVGALAADPRGIAVRGLLLRHLIMPHNIGGTDGLVQWAAKSLTKGAAVNLMAQYRPEHRAKEFPRLTRPITRQELKQALVAAQQAGLKYDRELDLHFV
ncbi:MAG: radical SAM protein [bacterium]